MKINELQPRQGKVELQAKVIDKSEPRTFDKFGKQGQVCNAKIKDDTGEMTLSLWNEQVDQVNLGDVVKISNGYVSEYKGEMQLSTGKFGTLEIIDMTTEDHGEHILSKDEQEEAEIINKEMEVPSPEEEVTKDELEESEMESIKKSSEPVNDDPDDEDIEIDEEKVE
ncbi:MAG: SOSS complex subunit B family protein [Candidatus Woesearchaeota archaeon]